MSDERIGWGGQDVREAMNSPQISDKSSGPEVTETFNTNWATAETAISNRGITFGDACPVKAATYAAAKLSEISLVKVGPKNARIQYVYRVPESDPSPPPVGTLFQETDSNAIDIPIGQHPNASTGTNYDDDKKIGKGDWIHSQSTGAQK